MYRLLWQELQVAKKTIRMKKGERNWVQKGDGSWREDKIRVDIYPVPLSVLVEKNDDQFREHLVTLFAEWQVPAFKCDIHEVPEDEDLSFS